MSSLITTIHKLRFTLSVVIFQVVDQFVEERIEIFMQMRPPFPMFNHCTTRNLADFHIIRGAKCFNFLHASVTTTRKTGEASLATRRQGMGPILGSPTRPM